MFMFLVEKHTLITHLYPIRNIRDTKESGSENTKGKQRKGEKDPAENKTSSMIAMTVIAICKKKLYFKQICVVEKQFF